MLYTNRVHVFASSDLSPSLVTAMLGSQTNRPMVEKKIANLVHLERPHTYQTPKASILVYLSRDADDFGPFSALISTRDSSNGLTHF
jgi:hypothetical protein